jgi:DNA-binding Lrp family transcriptional regulator
MHNNFQERIIAILRGSPNELTSNEIAELLGPTAKNMSSRLSKLAAYGIISKVRHSCGPRASVNHSQGFAFRGGALGESLVYIKAFRQLPTLPNDP